MEENPRKTNVLVIDDNIEYCSLVKLKLEGLEGEGYNVESAYTGREGLEKIKDYAPDVVLLDAMMPLMDGYEVLDKIRKSEDNIRDLPIIMVSAKGMKGDVIRALSLGADDYLIKPFQFHILPERIRKAIDKRRRHPADDSGLR